MVKVDRCTCGGLVTPFYGVLRCIYCNKTYKKNKSTRDEELKEQEEMSYKSKEDLEVC